MRHGDLLILQSREDQSGSLTGATAAQLATGRYGREEGLSRCVEAVADLIGGRSDINRNHVDVRRIQRNDRACQCMAVARIMARGVADQHHEASAGRPERDRSRGDLEQAVDEVLGCVRAATRQEQVVDRRLNVALVGRQRLAHVEERRRIDLILVVGHSKLRCGLRADHRRQDVGQTRLNVRDRRAHAGGLVDQEDDVGVRRDRRGVNGLGDRTDGRPRVRRLGNARRVHAYRAYELERRNRLGGLSVDLGRNDVGRLGGLSVDLGRNDVGRLGLCERGRPPDARDPVVQPTAVTLRRDHRRVRRSTDGGPVRAHRARRGRVGQRRNGYDDEQPLAEVAPDAWLHRYCPPFWDHLTELISAVTTEIRYGERSARHDASIMAVNLSADKTQRAGRPSPKGSAGRAGQVERVVGRVDVGPARELQRLRTLGMSR